METVSPESSLGIRQLGAFEKNKIKLKNPTNWAQRYFPEWRLDHNTSHQVIHEVPGFTVEP